MSSIEAPAATLSSTAAWARVLRRISPSPASSQRRALTGELTLRADARLGASSTRAYVEHLARRQVYPTTLGRDELNEQIAGEHTAFLYTDAAPADGEYAGKLSMGVGGINACIISRRLK